MEGEEGALPEWVLQSFSDPRLTVARNEWFTKRCALACRHATDIGSGERVCFLDSGPLTHEAYLRVDARTARLNIQRQVRTLRRHQPTLSVLFLAHDATILRHIQRRSRPGERIEVVSPRVLEVQRQCHALANDYPSIVIVRNDEDYLKTDDLDNLWQLIQRHLHHRH